MKKGVSIIMKTLLVIPARYNSSRFEGKALARIDGIPMICRTCEQSSKANVERVVVATDDFRIKNIVEEYGFNCVMTDASHNTGTDRVAEVARFENFDNIINVQGDEPIIHPETINLIVDSLKEEGVYNTHAATEISDPYDLIDSSVCKVSIGFNNYAVSLSRSPIPFPKSNINYTPYKTVGVYGYTNSFLQKFKDLTQRPIELVEEIEQLRTIEYGYKLKMVITPHDSISVDFPVDIKRVEDKIRNL